MTTQYEPIVEVEKVAGEYHVKLGHSHHYYIPEAEAADAAQYLQDCLRPYIEPFQLIAVVTKATRMIEEHQAAEAESEPEPEKEPGTEPEPEKPTRGWGRKDDDTDAS